MASCEEAEYKHNLFQCYMAALTIHSFKRFRVFTAPPGQGKTYVMFLVAHYYLKKATVTKVFIFNPNAIVTAQITDTGSKHQPK